MPGTYLLSDAVTEICAKQKDYDEKRYGANDDKEYYRAKKLFWEAVNMLICPSDQLKTDYPSFYDFAVNLPGQHIHGLLTISDEPIVDGKIELMGLGPTAEISFMKLIQYINKPGKTGNQRYMRNVSMEKIGNMAAESIVPDNILYTAIQGTDIMFYPTTADDIITVTYIKTPNNDLNTTESLLEIFSMPFVLKAVELASQLLEYERTRK